MKKIVAFIVMCFICFSLVACGGTNYPGNTKSKYWLSEDNAMMFYFPAEAGRGNAAGHYLADEETIEDIILDWNAKTGVVEVMTAGYEKMFTANTVTDTENLICTFEITSQEEGYNFPAEIIFHWEQTVNFGCINNIHSWSDELWYIPGDSDAYYHCVVCSEKQLATKSIKGVDGATKIEATKYDVGEEIGSVTVTEEASIKHIVDNLNSLKLLKLEYNEPTAIEYELTFYDVDGEIMKTISVALGGWVEYHGSLHSVVSGEFDRTYIAGLFQSKSEQNLQFEIRDRAKEENLPCDDALEKFYEDESNEYYFSAIKSHYVIVTYNDGTLEDIVTALYAGRVTIADLDKFGIEYYINPKQ